MDAKVEGTSSFAKRRGRIYVGHLPFGFYNEALKSYFSQFGKVTKVRVEKSKRTGNYKGYAFVEFENESVAKIAAEATDNYIIGSKILVSRYISPENQHKKVLGAKKNFGKHRLPPSVLRTNKCAAVGLSQKSLLNTRKKYLKLHSTLAEYGIEYDEAPINLDNLEERLKEAEGREERLKQLDEEIKERQKSFLEKRLKNIRKRKPRVKVQKKVVEKTNAEGEKEEDKEVEDEFTFESKSAVSTFEQALDVIKSNSAPNDENSRALSKHDGSSDLVSTKKETTIEELTQQVIPSELTGKKRIETSSNQTHTKDHKKKGVASSLKAVSRSENRITTENETEKLNEIPKKKKKSNEPKLTEPTSSEVPKDLKVEKKVLTKKAKPSTEEVEPSKVKAKFSREKVNPSIEKAKSLTEKAKLSSGKAKPSVEKAKISIGKVKTSKEKTKTIEKKNPSKMNAVATSTHLPTSSKKEVTVESFRHKVKNIKYKYID